jgi:stalled ribosome alternative rescue factor ArfA
VSVPDKKQRRWLTEPLPLWRKYWNMYVKFVVSLLAFTEMWKGTGRLDAVLDVLVDTLKRCRKERERE